MKVCSQMSLSAVVLMSPVRITNLKFLCEWSVEMYSHRETPAVVSDALLLMYLRCNFQSQSCDI